MGLPTTPLEHSRRGWGSTLGGRALIPEEEAITYIALAAGGGDRLKAEALYLSAARSGELSVYGCRSMSGFGHELMPRERWQVAVHQALPDPLCGVFHFTWREGWYDREVRRLELEQLWPVVASSSAAAAPSGGPPPEPPCPPAVPPGIEPERWRAIWEKYVEHVRDVQEKDGRLPKIAEDTKWRSEPGIDISREEVRKLRKFVTRSRRKINEDLLGRARPR